MITQSKLNQIYNESKQMRFKYLQLANRVEGMCEEIGRLRQFIIDIYNEIPAEQDELHTKIIKEVESWNE